MSTEIFLAFLLFAVVTTATPGPNNVTVLASGVNFGLKRTMPTVFGITAGVALMFLAVAFGLHAAFEAYPWLHGLVKYAGCAYLLYLAWKIAGAGPIDGTAKPPLGFVGGALFQWVNPKAWAMCVGAAATYLPREDATLGAVLIAATFWAVGVACVTAWAAFGSSMRRFLADPVKRRRFNVAMALALVVSLVPILAS